VISFPASSGLSAQLIRRNGIARAKNDFLKCPDILAKRDLPFGPAVNVDKDRARRAALGQPPQCGYVHHTRRPREYTLAANSRIERLNRHEGFEYCGCGCFPQRFHSASLPRSITRA
jgi:hypothetical protein